MCLDATHTKVQSPFAACLAGCAACSCPTLAKLTSQQRVVAGQRLALPAPLLGTALASLRSFTTLRSANKLVFGSCEYPSVFRTTSCMQGSRAVPVPALQSRTAQSIQRLAGRARQHIEMPGCIRQPAACQMLVKLKLRARCDQGSCIFEVQ